MCKKILIIDDEQDVITFLSTVLKKHGYETVTAANGVEGLAAARRERPDLITLDLMMPRQSGTDFYRNLQRDKELGQIPIIVISGLAGRNLVVRKPAAVFDKPIDPDVFMKAVEQALQ